MKHLVLVSVTVYLFYIFVYAAWAFVAFEILGNPDIASYIYLPHGARVLMFCFFRWRSIPALIAAESTGYGLITISLLDIAQEPSIWWWELSMISSLLSVVLSVVLVKWCLGDTGIATGLLGPHWAPADKACCPECLKPLLGCLAPARSLFQGA